MKRSSRPLIGALVVLSIAGLTGCQTSINSTASNGNPKHFSHFSTYSQYHNQRFGFRVDCPSSWLESPRPTDGDGRVFTKPSGVPSFNNGTDGNNPPSTDVVMTAVGVSNVTSGPSVGQNFNQMVAQIIATDMKDKKDPNVLSVTYQVIPGKGVWTVEVRKVEHGHDAINYWKQFISVNSIETLSFTYPASQAAKYQPIVNHVAQSFVPGNQIG